ncbi:hypothetical protein C8J57DRAFT_1508744 [Mycena rebaudengoi]|nr:hypothetical protein C8J57DRAFT_1508744 [Mycena rebaudengoi]
MPSASMGPLRTFMMDGTTHDPILYQSASSDVPPPHRRDSAAQLPTIAPPLVLRANPDLSDKMVLVIAGPALSCLIQYAVVLI